MDYTTENKLIADYLRELKMPSVKEYLEETASQANAESWTYRTFLCRLLEREVGRRAENRKQQRIRRACFPEMKYLQEIVREELPQDGRTILPELETLRFIKECRNVVLYGNPGTGKTHIAIGLGLKACLEGYTIYFTTIAQLLLQIREALSSRTLRNLQRRFTSYDLVICDEFGYVSFDKEGGEQIFNLLSLRAGKKALVTTTNLPFTRWDEIIKDKALCAALVDRLCYKAFLVNMSGPSFRVKETKKMFEKSL